MCVTVCVRVLMQVVRFLLAYLHAAYLPELPCYVQVYPYHKLDKGPFIPFVCVPGGLRVGAFSPPDTVQNGTRPSVVILMGLNSGSKPLWCGFLFCTLYSLLWFWVCALGYDQATAAVWCHMGAERHCKEGVLGARVAGRAEDADSAASALSPLCGLWETQRTGGT